MRVLGLKPSQKKELFCLDVARKTKRPCFNPTLLSIGFPVPSESGFQVGDGKVVTRAIASRVSF